MTLHRKTAYYITGCVIIALTLITLLFEASQDAALMAKEDLFPNFQSQKNNIQKIQILQDGKKLTLQKQEKGWVIAEEDHHPVRLSAITELLNWIENTQTISRKTQDSHKFERIGLLNPDVKKTDKREGSGVRIILFAQSKVPLIDFIVGEKFHSFKMRDKERFFIRPTTEGAYLVESNNIPNFEPFFYLANAKGLPAIEKISSLSLYLNGKKEYTFQSHYKDDRKILNFFPTRMPAEKRLIYPNIATDFVKAITTKLYPKGAVMVDYTNQTAPDRIEIVTNDQKNITLNFRKMNNNIHYMLILSDMNKPSEKIYAYHIDEKDYKGVLQPFKAFITNDVQAKYKQ